jgi:hypothetical protein
MLKYVIHVVYGAYGSLLTKVRDNILKVIVNKIIKCENTKIGKDNGKECGEVGTGLFSCCRGGVVKQVRYVVRPCELVSSLVLLCGGS